jgi:3-hydroxybutyrate dehydrogenase
VVTGAGRGIGAAIVKRLLADGLVNRVIAVDLIPPTEAPAPGVEPLALDVANQDQVMSRLPLALGGAQVAMLINNAGICDENQPGDLETWHRVLGVNLHGAYHVITALLPHLREPGRIINIASVLGRGGQVRNTAYCASKHGLLGLTKALALDLAPRGITVNAILPGWVETPMLLGELTRQAQVMGVEPEQVFRKARRGVPIRRFVVGDDIAATASFLASAGASAITAQCFTVDGGFTVGY